MPIAWRAGVIANSGGNPGHSCAAAIPAAAVPGNDVVLALGFASGTATTISLGSAGPSPVNLAGGTYNEPSSPTDYAAWWIPVNAGDPGSLVTLASTGNSYLGLMLLAYSGASRTSPVDVIAAGNGPSAVTFTGPSAVTASPGDWVVQAAAYLAGGSISGHPGTLRADTGAYAAQAADSAGPAGPAGTAIGGGLWTGPAAAAWAGMVIGLKPGPAGGSSSIIPLLRAM
jgi:hypothetical protein